MDAPHAVLPTLAFFFRQFQTPKRCEAQPQMISDGIQMFSTNASATMGFPPSLWPCKTINPHRANVIAFFSFANAGGVLKRTTTRKLHLFFTPNNCAF